MLPVFLHARIIPVLPLARRLIEWAANAPRLEEAPMLRPDQGCPSTVDDKLMPAELWQRGNGGVHIAFLKIEVRGEADTAAARDGDDAGGLERCRELLARHGRVAKDENPGPMAFSLRRNDLIAAPAKLLGGVPVDRKDLLGN